MAEEVTSMDCARPAWTVATYLSMSVAGLLLAPTPGVCEVFLFSLGPLGEGVILGRL